MTQEDSPKRISSDLKTSDEAAQFLGLSRGTLEVWRCALEGPAERKASGIDSSTRTDQTSWTMALPLKRECHGFFSGVNRPTPAR